MPTVKIGTGRQIVIPKNMYERLRLAPGDRLGVSLHGRELVFTARTIVEMRLDRALADLRGGRVHGAFGSVDEMLGSLAAKKRATKRRPTP